MHDDPFIGEERLPHCTLEHGGKLPNELLQLLLLLITEGLEVLNGAELEEAQHVHPVASLHEQNR